MADESVKEATPQAATPATPAVAATPAAAAAPATPETPDDKGGTILTAPESEAGKVEKTNVITTADDWREQLSGGNKDDLKTLNRYSSPAGVWNALKAMRAKMSAGELKAVSEFPADGDDAAKAKWRKDNGIPESAEAYEPKVDGLVFGDADKPMLDSFKAHAFTKNWTPAQFNEALQWYAAEQESAQSRVAEQDEQFRTEARDSLYAEWGPQDFRRNVNAVQNMFAAAPEGLRDRIFGARLADGRLAGDDPEFLKFFAQLARENNPAATLVPANADAAKSVSDELASIRKLRREDPDKYDQDKTLQARELELLSAQSKMKSRAA